MKLIRVMLMLCVTVAALVSTALPAQAGTATVRAFAPYSKATSVDIDNGDPGRSVGDQTVGNFKLRKNGGSIGHLDFVCTVTNLSPRREECHAAAHLTGRGQLIIAGVQNSRSEITKVAITGGTGEFSRASGTGTLDFTGRTGAHFTFHITT